MVSLFKYDPLNGTTEVISDSDTNFSLPFDRSTLKDLLDLGTKYSAFIVDKQQYLQVDKGAMGSTVESISANVFMCFSENK